MKDTDSSICTKQYAASYIWLWQTQMHSNNGAYPDVYYVQKCTNYNVHSAHKLYSVCVWRYFRVGHAGADFYFSRLSREKHHSFLLVYLCKLIWVMWQVSHRHLIDTWDSSVCHLQHGRKREKTTEEVVKARKAKEAVKIKEYNQLVDDCREKVYVQHLYDRSLYWLE